MGLTAMRDVVKRYGSTIALDHVSFELQKGEILQIFAGQSGIEVASTGVPQRVRLS